VSILIKIKIQKKKQKTKMGKGVAQPMGVAHGHPEWPRVARGHPQAIGGGSMATPGGLWPFIPYYPLNLP